MSEARAAPRDKSSERWRHEWKYELSVNDLIRIRSRLQAVARPDPHAGPNGRYRIRSLYFDNGADSALWEKISGVGPRAKFRIRYYNGDAALIRLEKKIKRNGLCLKVSEPIAAEEVQLLLMGNPQWIMTLRPETRPLALELYARMKDGGLLPKTIVDYEREPYIYDAGNVRVTFDSDLRTGFHCADFLNPVAMEIPAGTPPLLMEVKWDAFLPSVIRDAIQTNGRSVTAFSKYAQCRSVL